MANENRTYYADVILPVPLVQYYTYLINPEFIKDAEIGKRVLVQFGKKKFYTGIIRAIHENKPEHYEVKAFTDVLDTRPIVSELHLKYWEWIASYYMCSVGEVFKAAFPTGLKLESETKLLPLTPDDLPELSESEFLVYNYLKNKEVSDVNSLSKDLRLDNAMRIVNGLIDKNAVTAVEKIRKVYQAKKEAFVRFHQQWDEESKINQLFDQLQRAPKQLNTLMAYISLSGVFSSNEREVKKIGLQEKAGVNASVINTLVEKSVFEVYQKEVGRIGLGDYKGDVGLNDLNELQKSALTSVYSSFEEKEVCLLHGVTSSGKTELYIHLIQHFIQKGKQVLYLLPEIALTAQIINRLQKAFGNSVGVYHSKFSDAERVEIFKEISKGSNSKFRLILGVRSSVFLPFSDLGLVIVDEEHENTYKQNDPAPRYNARDVSVVLSRYFSAKVLLGSATPSLETYFNAKTGRYGLVELKQRFKNIAMPQILIADIADARKRKQMKSMFTPLLIEKINEAISNKEQVILFQNRRGYAPYMECEMCGWIPKCPHCDVSLTYHKYNKSLNCHYCNYTESVRDVCPACGNMVLQTKGFGTEQIESEVEELFPVARVGRLDLDSTRKKHAHEEIIAKFENYELDILIGTQMVTKGLDFDRVSLVGILNADNMLAYPDYRAFERAFQLMSQVSGRSGRKYKQGMVIIQSSQPEHPVIQYVLHNKQETFYKEQIAERKAFNYPPFFRHIRIQLKHKNHTTVDQAARFLANALRKGLGERVLGPEQPVIGKIHDYYLRNIHLKIERDKISTQLKTDILKTSEHIKSQKNNSAIVIIYDVDPY